MATVVVAAIKEVSPGRFDVTYYDPSRPSERYSCAATAKEDMTVRAAIQNHINLRKTATMECQHWGGQVLGECLFCNGTGRVAMDFAGMAKEDLDRSRGVSTNKSFVVT